MNHIINRLKKHFNKTNIEYWAFRAFMAVMLFFPYRFILFFSRRMAILGYYILKNSRNDALSSLKIAYPEKTEKEREYIAKKSFKNLITTFTEFAYSSKWSDEKLKSIIKTEGLDNLKNALKKGKGAIVITGHLGNWEYIAAISSILGIKSAFIVRSLDNYRIDKYIRLWRTKRGDKIIGRREGELREIFQSLKENRPVGFLSDQNFSDGIFVYFFGKLACTAAGSIAMAMKTRSPIIFIYARRNKDYTHTVIYTEEMALEWKETKEKTLLHNTQRYTKILEDIIRSNPEEWLWAHRRWNTYLEERPNALRYDKIDEY